MSERPEANVETRDSGATARRYHQGTDHRNDPAILDTHYATSMIAELRPRLYKRYPTLEPIPLTRDLPPSQLPALDAITDGAGLGASERPAPDLATVARLYFFTDGITKRLRRGERELAFRAAPCTGALYHVELYLVCADLPDLPAGIYHYNVEDHALRRLRAGDYRGVIVEATGDRPRVAHSPLLMVTTSVFWRNAWKYTNRAYRHTYWDSGTMLPNTLAVAVAAGLAHELVLSFADQPVADLLGVDLEREGIVSIVALGATDASPPAPPPLPPLDLPTEPYSVREIDYPLIRETHRATLLSTSADAAGWRETVRQFVSSPAYRGEPVTRSGLVSLPEPNAASLPTDPIETVIRRRGSTRRFARDPITLHQLSTMLDRATRGVPFDGLSDEGIPFDGNDAFLIVNAVQGLAPGSYVYHREDHALEPLRRLTEDEARERTAFLAWEQDLGGDAAVNVYFLAALDPLLAAGGDRGYRLAQLGGALVAGKLYLAAYALGLGATGLTFLDDEVIGFLGPHAEQRSVMYLIAIGVPAPRPSA